SCSGIAYGQCSDPGTLCVPSTPAPRPPSGLWSYCVSHDGAGDAYTLDCPKEYPTLRVFGADYSDSRGCTPCSCGAPQGSYCSSLVVLYPDGVCSSHVRALTATSISSVCGHTPPGSPLGSKQENPPMYSAGECTPSGGEMVGALTYVGPITFCCMN